MKVKTEKVKYPKVSIAGIEMTIKERGREVRESRKRCEIAEEYAKGYLDTLNGLLQAFGYVKAFELMQGHPANGEPFVLPGEGEVEMEVTSDEDL